MPRFLTRMLCLFGTIILLSLGSVAPAEAAKKPPAPQGCTYSGGKTTCVESTSTTGPGPLDGQACTTDNGLPGTYSQESTTTTTTTRTYKGRTSSGTPLSQKTTTSTQDGPATCTANPTPPGTIVITPYPTCHTLNANPMYYACYEATGASLEPFSTPLLHYVITTNGVSEPQVQETGPVSGSGNGTFSYPEFYCNGTYYDSDAYFTGIGADGNPVQSNTVQPCPPPA